MHDLTLEDRSALRALVDAYADAVDRQDVPGAVRLFAPDGCMVVTDHRLPPRPPTRLTGHDELAAGLAHVHRYAALTHVVGGLALAQSDADPTRVTGITTCLAHHVLDRGERRVLQVMGVKYHDTFVLVGEGWRFAERHLEFQWREERAMGSGPQER